MIALAPSARRAAELDRRMRRRLADSLRHILDSAHGRIDFPASGLDDFFARLDAGPVAPSAFGAYFELVPALEDGEFVTAVTLLHEIAVAPAAAAAPHIINLGDVRDNPAVARYQRMVDTDPASPFSILPPAPADALACRALIGEAFALLDRADAALAGEIRALLREIILAAGPDSPDALQFDGASTFMLWGMIVLNVRSHASRLDMAQALAHESGHNLLFGLCADGPLDRTDDAARFASPLRADPRPMDGVIHSTYVTARMHRAVAALLGSGMLDDAEQAAARAALAAHEHAFADGMQVISRHAQLTPLGRDVMDGAAAHMRGVAQAVGSL